MLNNNETKFSAEFKNSNYFKHAMTEFKHAGFIDENNNYIDEIQEAICVEVLKLLEIFNNSNHSGTSDSYSVNLFEKLSCFKPLSPINNSEDEWDKVGENEYQHKRCNSVFKKFISNGDKWFKSYDINGKVFWEWQKSEDGELYKSSFTNGNSKVPVTFPYTPKTEYVFCPTDEFPEEKLNENK